MSTKSARRRRNQRAAAHRTQTKQQPQRTGVNLLKPATAPVQRGVNLTKLRQVEPANYQLEAAAWAALYAGSLGFSAPFDAWEGAPDGTATTTLADGTRLLYNPGNPADRLGAQRQCRHDQWHTRRVTEPKQLEHLRTDTVACRQHATTIQGTAVHGTTVHALHDKQRDYARTGSGYSPVSPRPTEWARMAADLAQRGCTTAQVAEQLHVTEATAGTLLARAAQ